MAQRGWKAKLLPGGASHLALWYLAGAAGVAKRQIEALLGRLDGALRRTLQDRRREDHAYGRRRRWNRLDEVAREVSNADNFADQWKLNDPYGHDCGSEECIANLLRASKGRELSPERAAQHAKGYDFVETVDPRDRRLYRYTAAIHQGWNKEAVERYRNEKGQEPPPYSYEFRLERSRIEEFTARFGIAWDDVSTP